MTYIADNVCFLFSRMGTEECAEEQSMLLLSFPILMLSPASTSEILIGKSFLTAVLMLVAVAASIALSEVRK